MADGAYFLQARPNVSVPGVDADVAQALVDAAHQTCPHSTATRGNIDVVVTVIRRASRATPPADRRHAVIRPIG